MCSKSHLIVAWMSPLTRKIMICLISSQYLQYHLWRIKINVTIQSITRENVMTWFAAVTLCFLIHLIIVVCQPPQKMVELYASVCISSHFIDMSVAHNWCCCSVNNRRAYPHPQTTILCQPRLDKILPIAEEGMGHRRSIENESSGHAHFPSLRLSALEEGNHSIAKLFDISKALLARIGMLLCVSQCYRSGWNFRNMDVRWRWCDAMPTQTFFRRAAINRFWRWCGKAAINHDSRGDADQLTDDVRVLVLVAAFVERR